MEKKNIKMGLVKLEGSGFDSSVSRGPVNMVRNNRVPYKEKIVLNSCATVSFLKRILLCGVSY
jgi:hypothetical protein